MLRLSPPTNRTFLIGVALLILGVVGHLGYVGDLVDPDLSFWLTAAGGGVLTLGSLFNKI